jgi:hydroxypyruvate isomerase
LPRFAANLSMMFTEKQFPKRFAAASAAGFSAVEFLFPYEFAPQTIATWLMENQLENVLFNFPPGDWTAGERGLAALPGREEEFRQSVTKALEYATALGTRRLHMMAGLVMPGADKRQCEAVYLSNLKFAARRLAEYGINLMIEPINHRDMPGYFLNTQDQAHILREKSDESNVFVQMDFYHAQITQGDLAHTLKKYIKAIGHIQIASVPDRHEPDDGEINYAYLFRLIDELGYQGWVGCEYRPKGATEEGLNWLNERRSAENL